jgi:signal transduction histidine kinase
MSIRTRLSLWYAGILLVSLLAMSGLSYYLLVLEPRRVALAANPRANREDEGDLSDVLTILVWCGLPSLAIAIGGGWWMTRKALGPLASLTQGAECLNERNLGTRLPRTGNGDELDRLTEVFNAMTERLGQSFERVRQFTLHASHELKTPLTIMHGEVETMLRDETLTEAQRERLASELDEIQRLTKVVDSLTLLTKADTGQVTLKRQPVRLDELVHEACDDARSLARPRGIQVNLGQHEELTVNGDRGRLRQLLLNLCDNAIKYNQLNGTVSVWLCRAGENAILTFANTGKGIAPEALPHVFERFFRGDPSHSSEVEGCGLGLSIAQWIAQAHGGAIEIASEPGTLTTVIVRLPLARAQGA